MSSDVLLRMYRLDALVAITESDRKGAVYATIRVVTIDPDAAPDPELGPELGDMHQTWSARLAENVIRVAYQGDGTAWVDGREVTKPWIEVYAGEHLFQYDGPDGWVSRVREADKSLTLGPPGATPPPDPEPEVVPTPGAGSGRKVRRTALLVSGGGLGAAGGALVLMGHLSERRFMEAPYDAATYGGCSLPEPCWATARESQIRSDAAAVRALYAAGYVAAGLGVAVIGTELLLLPAPTSGGGALLLSGKF
ncbi:MAG: hypothetical protein EP330_13605 [Deltaproteobacteria bacterium]|nr:MAG: hypothetical protein EP330_13605 [Deltaproteobacteria bacterium]